MSVDWISIKRNAEYHLLHSTRNRYHKTVCQPTVLIDEKFSRCSPVENLSVDLLEHQKASVHAMIDLENTRSLTLVDKFSKTQYKINSSAGVLSDPVGSGKTYTILALIAQQKRPKIKSDITHFPRGYESSIADIRHDYSAAPTINRQFVTILKPTIIFVGRGIVFTQWKKAINGTNLKMLTVNNVRDVRKLIDTIANGSINKYNIILVKNGNISGKYSYPGSLNIEIEPKNKISSPYIYNVISNIRTVCWARVIVDDFDTIRLPSNAGIINGIFTWYVSSTLKRTPNRTIQSTKYTKTSEFLKYMNYGCGRITNNYVLFEYFNIRCSAGFIKNSCSVTYPKFYIRELENPDNSAIEMLNSIGTDDAKRYAEMLNGGLLKNVAKEIGINADSAKDVWRLILGAEHAKYAKASNCIKFIEDNIDRIDHLDPIDPEGEDKYYGKKRLRALDPINYKYPGLKLLLEQTYEEQCEIKKKIKIIIDRVKSNITEGECLICYEDFADLEEGCQVLVLKCCHCTICSQCVFACVFKNMQNGNCPQCRARITPNFTVSVDEAVDLADVVDEHVVCKTDDQTDTDDKKVSDEPATITKLDALLELLNSKPSPDTKEIHMDIPNIMKGNHEYPDQKLHPKVIVVSNYKEAFEEIKTTLTEAKIENWVLKGQDSKVNFAKDSFSKYDKGPCVLMLDSFRNCSGANLECATHIVFTHLLGDENVEIQVIGRGQRMNRTSQIKVVYLLHKNETAALKNRRTVTYL
jgi:hypothetical protein